MLTLSLLLNAVLCVYIFFGNVFVYDLSTSTSTFLTSALQQSSSLVSTTQSNNDDNHRQHYHNGSRTSPVEPHFLEDLMYTYGSDKSHDDHSYTDMYQMLFDAIRFDVKNITEVGVSAGQSLQAWYRYFPNAEIHAFDVATLPSTARIAEQLKDRVHYQEINLLKERETKSLKEISGLQDNSMDIVWEDAMHAPRQQQAFCAQLFRIVKPGGYYIIEDIAYTNMKSRHWHEDISLLLPEVQEILHNNDAIFVDTHIGHRDWDEWKKRTVNAVDHVVHNSYLMVIRKRLKQPRPVQMNLRNVAMLSDKVVFDEGSDTK